ncbi:SDR family oxidoreductase [Ruegeria sp. 2012CJ41-6]|uniref:SDR family oxidoreductase n=1 Tax=Ruegeria spongiae TaxID=2942209 RepID=A0ABT0Q9V6_9RHOB|nr:SDR family oxidoreductase [Ruegeria spongiae]MCL6285679.1 SDR family oxidoreductase [Ruegeria spongiae]
MDLGLTGKKAIVCGASRGLGLACAQALAGEGAQVLIVARNTERLKSTASSIEKESGVGTEWISADVTSKEGQAAIFDKMSNPDILITNCDGPPPGQYTDWDDEDWQKALQANMISPIALIKRALPGMIERRFGRIINITSSAVKAPIPVLGLSNGARAGLTGFIAGLAREVARNNVTINNLLPGPFETDRLSNVLNAQAEMQNRKLADVRQEWLDSIPTRAFGQPMEFGRTCAFLCASNHINGQNVLLDGGAFPGVF